MKTFSISQCQAHSIAIEITLKEISNYIAEHHDEYESFKESYKRKHFATAV